MDLCILASGSSGNCSIVRCGDGAILIDAGIGPRTCAARLNGLGVTLDAVRAILLTHLDRDHFTPHFAATIVARGIQVHCHRSLRGQVIAMLQGVSDLVRPFDAGEFSPMPEVNVAPIHLAHDREGSHGFVIDAEGCRIAYATDLGHVPAHLPLRFSGADVLALESNYDPAMQLASRRSARLKQRIMGGRGHLSNDQALELIRAVFDQSQRRGDALPGNIVLLHRSRQCNCPRLLRDLFSRDSRLAGRVIFAEQHQRTEWITPRPRPPIPGEQLRLWA